MDAHNQTNGTFEEAFGRDLSAERNLDTISVVKDHTGRIDDTLRVFPFFRVVR